MVRDVNFHCNYKRVTGHHTDDCFMLHRDIETLIQRDFLKIILDKRKRSRSPLGKDVLPLPPPLLLRDSPHSKRGTIIVISGGFASGREKSDTGEVYAMNIHVKVVLGKRPRLIESDVISFFDEDLGHVVNPYEDTMVITSEIDRYDV